MKKLPIYYQGEEAGCLEVERDGLYLRFLARCRAPDGTGVLRLWAVGGEREAYLGIPAPEGDALTLCRRLPASGFARTSWTHGVLGDHDASWHAFSGMAAGFSVKGGLCRTIDGTLEIALPLDPAQPFSFLPLLPRLRAERIDGAPWLVLRQKPEERT